MEKIFNDNKNNEIKKKIIKLKILDFVDMGKVYNAFLDSFKEMATEIELIPKKNPKQRVIINRICETIFNTEKISKFIQIYELLEDLGDFYNIYFVRKFLTDY